MGGAPFFSGKFNYIPAVTWVSILQLFIVTVEQFCGIMTVPGVFTSLIGGLVS